MGSAVGTTADCKLDKTRQERASLCELGVLHDRPAARSILPIYFSLNPPTQNFNQTRKHTVISDLHITRQFYAGVPIDTDKPLRCDNKERH